jgi:hypothetical protein
MESKIMIDINYASRDPQIVIHQKDSDDPRDKLVSMFTGHSMPGVRDGYCRIERMPNDNGGTEVVITPIWPTDLIKHIPLIAKFAHENPASDTAGVPSEYRKIIEGEYARICVDKDGVPIIGQIQREILKKADEWAVGNLPHDLYKVWHKEMFGFEPRKISSQG